MKYLVLLAALPAAAAAQPAGCTVSENLLRCTNGLTLRTAPGTQYQLVASPGASLPTAARVTNGAVLVELEPGGGPKSFQILTPYAIASVRGTQWAMDVTAEQTSALVLKGTVVVTRPGEKESVVLGPNDGVDIQPGRAPLTAHRWGAARIAALMARFGK